MIKVSGEISEVKAILNAAQDKLSEEGKEVILVSYNSDRNFLSSYVEVEYFVSIRKIKSEEEVAAEEAVAAAEESLRAAQEALRVVQGI